MAVVWTVLGVLAKTLGILLLVVLAVIFLALVIPVSVWLAYDGDDFSVQVGALGLKYPVFSSKEEEEDEPEPDQAKAATSEATEKAAPNPPQPPKPKPAPETAQAKTSQPPKVSQPQPKAQTAKAAPKAKASAKTTEKAKNKPTPKPVQPAKKPAEKPAQQDKNLLLGLSFDQLVTAVKGLGKFGQRIVAGLKIRHIRLYVPITGDDAADTAIKYGKCQAWLHAGLGVLNRAIWLDFDECRLEADFLAKEAKKPHFSCQISAQLLIMVIAALRYLWLLWRAKILEALLAQFSGSTSKEKDNG